MKQTLFEAVIGLAVMAFFGFIVLLVMMAFSQAGF